MIDGWIQVYNAASEVEAQLLCDTLRAEGIDAQVFSQHDSAFQLALGGLSVVRVLVPAEEQERARELIRDQIDTAGGIGFNCPSCGEVFEPGAASCAACGEPLV